MRIWMVGLVLLGGSATAMGSEALFDQVTGKAKALASQPYRANDAPPLPADLQELDYQGYRDIRFRKEQALWAGDGTGFRVELFHPGFLYRHPVTVHNVVDGDVRPVPFTPSMFDYGKHAAPEGVPGGMGFAGFRLHYPVHDPAYADELIAFLGASYFRMVGRDQRYGLSARGLAIDTALPSGEEFPRFTEFWLVQPAADSNRVEFYALLESESVTGAYAFALESRAQTVLDVRARLFARSNVRRLGIAPLTSMFAWGENAVRPVDDYRPEVHDSDGLLHHTSSGERIWRPLVNPPELQVSTLLDSNLRGFGLAQRDRRFDQYQDAEARYELRPGIWVEPRGGDWGRGAVNLVEIPTPDETHDNIVAFWVDDRPFEAGDTRQYAYRLSTFESRINPDGLASVTGTRNGWGWIPGSEDKPPKSLRQFVVDFQGGELAGLSPQQPVQAELSVGQGEARKATVNKLPGDEGWRVAFKLQPADLERSVNMRLFLTLRGRRISETWNYLWNPASVTQP